MSKPLPYTFVIRDLDEDECWTLHVFGQNLNHAHDAAMNVFPGQKSCAEVQAAFEGHHPELYGWKPE